LNNRKLTIATCQHDICGNINKNLSYILRQIKEAKLKSADIVHFSECNLTGYAGVDIPEITISGYSEIQNGIDAIKKEAEQVEIKVIVGSHHYVSEEEKPRNCLYLISENGEVETRYDKRILAGITGSMDHLHYSQGNVPITFKIHGIKCGMLICHEWRYPELYREYKKLGVELLFQSWYDGGLDHMKYSTEGIHTGDLIVGSVKGNAANNYFWISGSNTSNKESCFSSFVVQPDGRIVDKLPRNKPGVLVTTIDIDKKYSDPSFHGRKRFM